MMKHYRLAAVLLIGLVSLMQGCASTDEHTQSGFLSNYERLQPDNRYDNTRIYVDSSFDREDMAKVTKVYIHPFELWLTQESLPFLGSQQVAELTGYFHTKLSEALAPNYTLVDRMGWNTLGIRGAFTHIELSSPEMSPTDLLPFRVVMNAGNLAYLEATGQQDVVTQVGIEVAFTHNRPGKVILEMTSVRQLDSTVDKGVEGNIQAIKQVLDTWIMNFTAKLDEIRESN